MRQNNHLEQVAQALYISWFIDFEPFGGSIPDGWTTQTLDNLCSLVVKGITPKYVTQSEYRVINQKCIRNHEIDMGLARFHMPKANINRWLNKGDLLINSTGTGTLGRAAQVAFEPVGITADSHITIVRAKSPDLVDYIGTWGIMHEHDFELMATGSTGQTDLPRERLKAMPVVVPDTKTLSDFSSQIASINTYREKNQRENQALASIRDSLLPRLMSGELDVSGIDL